MQFLNLAAWWFALLALMLPLTLFLLSSLSGGSFEQIVTPVALLVGAVAMMLVARPDRDLE